RTPPSCPTRRSSDLQGLDGPLNVAVAERSAGGETAGVEHLAAIDVAEALDHDGVGGRRAGLALRPGRARGQHDGTQNDEERKPAGHAFEPESARNPRRSLSGATSTSTSSPRANSPTRIFSESGSSTYFWMARFNGRAPKCSS